MTKRLVFDFDYIKYTIAAACEKRECVVTHKPTGKQKIFKTKTDFQGHWKKRDGGWLAETNLNRMQEGKAPFDINEFEFSDKQTPEPLEFALSSVKNHINNIVETLGATSYYGYLGKGDSWRVEASTLLKYKGSRGALLKPIHLEEIEKYLITSHNAKIVRGLESDDKCVIDCTTNPELILVGVEKDFQGCNIKYYRHGVDEKPQDIKGFGELYLNTKGAVKGHGYVWWLHQVLSGDSSDEYAANSATDKKWGEKSSYKLLAPCTNEKEAWEAVIKGYKQLYPEPKLFKGWRGDEFMVDARYVLNENCVMAKMMTSDDYKFNLDLELDKFGLTMESKL